MKNYTATTKKTLTISGLTTVTDANGSYAQASALATGTAREWGYTGGSATYTVKWDAENSRWHIVDNAETPVEVAYQSTAADEPEAGTWTEGTVAATQDVETLFTVATGKELLVVTIQIAGGAAGGSLTLTRTDGAADVYAETLLIDANDAAILDHKQVFEAGSSLKAQASAPGMQISVSGELYEV